MKSNIRIKITVLIIVGIFLALSPIINNTLYFNAGYGDENLEHGDAINLDDDNLKVSKISGRIHIINNSEWVDFRNDGNCTGSGTYSDPYVIEDLVIDGGWSGDCIWIENSNVYFRIENCTVYSSNYYGIRLSRVNNSQLIDNDCSYNLDGINLEYCDNNTISGNTASYSDYDGIYLDSCDNNIVSGNTANYNEVDGIYLESCDNNIVSGNTANNNIYWYGITLILSDDNTVSGNTANNNAAYGMKIWQGNNNTISGNTANNNRHGINLDGQYYTVSGNTVSNNEEDGIHFSGIHQTISGNTAINNNKGILSMGYNSTISGNTASYNDMYGIYLYLSGGNTVSGNTANYNEYGIYLCASDDNTISGNTLIGNNVCIYETYDCDGNIIKNNDCGGGDEKIPGYDPFFLLGILSAVAILMRKRLKESLK